jgi:hypothetical protein
MAFILSIFKSSDSADSSALATREKKEMTAAVYATTALDI